jgi:hypothetical protein
MLFYGFLASQSEMRREGDSEMSVTNNTAVTGYRRILTPVAWMLALMAAMPASANVRIEAARFDVAVLSGTSLAVGFPIQNLGDSAALNVKVDFVRLVPSRFDARLTSPELPIDVGTIPSFGQSVIQLHFSVPGPMRSANFRLVVVGTYQDPNNRRDHDGRDRDRDGRDRGDRKVFELEVSRTPHEGVSLPPPGIPNRPQGTPALPVNPQGAQPFTKQDVINYFSTHNLPKNSGSLSQFAVDSLQFLTSKDVTTLLQGVTTGLLDDEVVAFVTLFGNFIFTGPAGTRPVQFARAYAVFDSITGNLLMVGTLPQEGAPS